MDSACAVELQAIVRLLCSKVARKLRTNPHLQRIILAHKSTSWYHSDWSQLHKKIMMTEPCHHDWGWGRCFSRRIFFKAPVPIISISISSFQPVYPARLHENSSRNRLILTVKAHFDAFIWSSWQPFLFTALLLSAKHALFSFLQSLSL